MKLQEKIDLIQSVVKVADFWECEVVNLIGFISLGESKKEKRKEWNEIARTAVEFDKMSIEERAKAMGFKVINNK